MKSLSNVSLVVALSIFTLSCIEKTSQLPPGWRLPVNADVESDDWRSEDTNRYLVARGDFNGDGVADSALLLMRDDDSGVGLFAFVSKTSDSSAALLLDEADESEPIHLKGIRKVAPGTYVTACGKGYIPCEEGEAPEVSLHHDAIDYFRYESANSFFYWDEQSDEFKRVWISD